MISILANLDNGKSEANVAKLISGQEDGDDPQLTVLCLQTNSLSRLVQDPDEARVSNSEFKSHALTTESCLIKTVWRFLEEIYLKNI